MAGDVVFCAAIVCSARKVRRVACYNAFSQTIGIDSTYVVCGAGICVAVTSVADRAGLTGMVAVADPVVALRRGTLAIVCSRAIAGNAVSGCANLACAYALVRVDTIRTNAVSTDFGSRQAAYTVVDIVTRDIALAIAMIVCGALIAVAYLAIICIPIGTFVAAALAKAVESATGETFGLTVVVGVWIWVWNQVLACVGNKIQPAASTHPITNFTVLRAVVARVFSGRCKLTGDAAVVGKFLAN